jgi:hypothetical protein
VDRITQWDEIYLQPAQDAAPLGGNGAFRRRQPGFLSVISSVAPARPAINKPIARMIGPILFTLISKTHAPLGFSARRRR